MNVPGSKTFTLGYDDLFDIVFTSPKVVIEFTVFTGPPEHHEVHTQVCPWTDGRHLWTFEDGCKLELGLTRDDTTGDVLG